MDALMNLRTNLFKWLLYSFGMIVVLYAIVYICGRAIDKKRTYKFFRYKFSHIDGMTYRVLFRYCPWQYKKRAQIEERYRYKFVYEDKLYKVIAPYKNKDESFFKGRIFKTYSIDVVPYEDVAMQQHIVNNVSTVVNGHNYGQVHSTIISENMVEVKRELLNELDILLQNENITLGEIEQISQFRESIADGSAKKRDASKFIEYMKTYVPFATAIINLVSALFKIAL